LTVNVRPATVKVPLRDCAPGLADPEKPTVPLPLPLAPLVTVSQPALLVAVHPQPASAVTAVDPVPPPTAIDWLAGEIEYVQLPAAWLTVNVCPATVSVPLRGDAVGFAVPLKVTMPLADPVVPPLTVSQLVLLVAVQLHPVGEVTFVEPVPPVPARDWLVGLIA
jgi:hypothetical protein